MIMSGSMLVHERRMNIMENTTGEQDKLFSSGSGIIGRTDLPPNYIYPFAAPGSVVSPDDGSIERYQLGANQFLPVC